jgi:hypothetical protein
MILVLGNLPKNTGEKEIKELLLRFAPISKIFFFKNKSTLSSDYECMVTMKISDPIVASLLARKLNRYSWKGKSIRSHRLIF